MRYGYPTLAVICCHIKSLHYLLLALIRFTQTPVPSFRFLVTHPIITLLLTTNPTLPKLPIQIARWACDLTLVCKHPFPPAIFRRPGWCMCSQHILCRSVRAGSFGSCSGLSSSGWHRRKLVLPPNSGLPSELPSRQGFLGLLRRGIFLDRCNVTPTQMPELPILLGTP